MYIITSHVYNVAREIYMHIAYEYTNYTYYIYIFILDIRNIHNYYWQLGLL